MSWWAFSFPEGGQQQPGEGRKGCFHHPVRAVCVKKDVSNTSLFSHQACSSHTSYFGEEHHHSPVHQVYKPRWEYHRSRHTPHSIIPPKPCKMSHPNGIITCPSSATQLLMPYCKAPFPLTRGSDRESEPQALCEMVPTQLCLLSLLGAVPLQPYWVNCSSSTHWSVSNPRVLANAVPSAWNALPSPSRAANAPSERLPWPFSSSFLCGTK